MLCCPNDTLRSKRAYKSPSLINLTAAQMTTIASTLTEIPQGDMYVTQCVQLGATLDVRFMVDFQPEEALEPQVLCMIAEQVSDASRCAQFLLDRREGNESVHLARAGNTLAVRSAGGISMDIAAASLKVQYDRLNEAELNEQLALVHRWYVSANSFLLQASGRVDAVRATIIEEIRRTELKAEKHDRAGAAGVLYAQHLAFMKRLLRLFGA